MNVSVVILELFIAAKKYRQGNCGRVRSRIFQS